MPGTAAVPSAGKVAPPADGNALKATSVAALKAMMREVVTAGTATALADVPGAPVFAKTGTAEFDDNPAHTHAWTVGWQGDVAFAVFIENGGSSAATAVRSSNLSSAPSDRLTSPYALNRPRPLHRLRP